MKYLLPVLVIFLFTACSKKKGAQSYDLPPSAPIPPEQICFLQNGPNPSGVELSVIGDSVLGSIKHAGKPVGGFKGVIYGTTLIVSYKAQNTGGKPEDQEWKISGDSLYRVNAKQSADTITTAIDSVNQLPLSVIFNRVPCK